MCLPVSTATCLTFSMVARYPYALWLSVQRVACSPMCPPRTRLTASRLAAPRQPPLPTDSPSRVMAVGTHTCSWLRPRVCTSPPRLCAARGMANPPPLWFPL